MNGEIFRTIYDEHRNGLHAYLLSRTGDREAALKCYKRSSSAPGAGDPNSCRRARTSSDTGCTRWHATSPSIAIEGGPILTALLPAAEEIPAGAPGLQEPVFAASRLATVGRAVTEPPLRSASRWSCAGTAGSRVLRSVRCSGSVRYGPVPHLRGEGPARSCPRPQNSCGVAVLSARPYRVDLLLRAWADQARLRPRDRRRLRGRVTERPGRSRGHRGCRQEHRRAGDHPCLEGRLGGRQLARLSGLAVLTGRSRRGLYALELRKCLTSGVTNL